MADDEDREESHKQQFALSEVQQSSFISFFRGLTASQDVIRFFLRNKSYYTVHGRDCEFIAREYIKTDRCVQLLGSKAEPLPSCTVNPKLFDEIVSDLWKRAKIEVWEQNDRTWEIIRQCSPGNTEDFDDIIMNDTGDSSVVVAVKFHEEAGRLKFGCAFCNTTQRVLGLAEFVDSDQCLNLEAFLIQVGAKECLLPQISKTEMPHEGVADTLKRLGTVRSEAKRADFAGKDVESLLPSLLREGSTVNDELEMKAAVGSLGALLKYLALTDGTTDEPGQYVLQKVQLQKYMRMDATAVRALNLFPETGGTFEQTTNRNASLSLFGLLNQCCTAMGSRTLKQWVTQPLLDRDEIERRQVMVEIFTEDVLFKQSLRDDILKKIPDLDSLVKKFHRKKARLNDTVTLANLVRLVPVLKRTLEGYSGVYQDLLKAEFIEPLDEICGHLDGLRQLIESTLDFSTPGEVVIAPTFDEELAEMAKHREAVDKKVDQAYQNALFELDMDAKNLKLEKTQQYGFSFRVTRQKDAALRGSKRFTILETKKDGVRFSNDQLMGLNKKRKDLVVAYEKRQSHLESKLQETVASYMPVIEDVKEFIIVLDIMLAWAHVVLEAPIQYIRPTILEASERKMKIDGARHPILENQDGVSFIPNDIHLDAKDKYFQMITGPNMGGKSTYIRMAGLLQHMAQLGMFIPANSATLSLRDCILARVGAADYQCRGVSTFMAEMLETSTILSNATEDSLIIVDELGRGTSTTDGFGLAWAIANHIATDIKAFCLYATHFHELTALERVVPGIGNIHVTADTTKGKLTMLYEIQKGPCSKSFGIHVAEIANFPSTVIENAKRKASELEEFDLPSDAKRGKLSKDVRDTLDQFRALPVKMYGSEDQPKLLESMHELITKIQDNPNLQAVVA